MVTRIRCCRLWAPLRLSSCSLFFSFCNVCRLWIPHCSDIQHCRCTIGERVYQLPRIGQTPLLCRLDTSNLEELSEDLSIYTSTRTEMTINRQE